MSALSRHYQHYRRPIRVDAPEVRAAREALARQLMARAQAGEIPWPEVWRQLDRVGKSAA